MNKTSIRNMLHVIFPVVLTLAGAVGGYLYYRFVGCATGTCAISSNPYVSTIYGAVIGLLLGLVVSPDKKKTS